MEFLIILFTVTILLGIGLLYLVKKRSKKETTENAKNNFNEAVTDMSSFYQIDDIYNGIIQKDKQYYMLARLEGLNFTVMSVKDQNAREYALVSILNRLDYPVRFIANTVIADTSLEARKVAELAAKTPEGALSVYRTLYAGELELMRIERRVNTQQTYLIVPGKTEDEVRDRINLLTSSLKRQANIIVNLIETTDDIYNILQEIIMPDKISKPAEVALTGVNSSVHFSEKEMINFGA